MEKPNIYFEYEKILRETNAFKKLVNYISSLERNPDFNESVKKIRKKLNIPQKGFPLPNGKKDYIIRTIHLSFDEVHNLIEKTEKKYALDIFGEAFEIYIVYNSIKPIKDFGFIDYAYCVDLADYLNEIKNKDVGTLETLESLSKTNPVAILIHPYMTQRDILDFIKKTYQTGIKPLQKKYKAKRVMLGIARSKSEKATRRSNFIYKNREKPIKEITELVREKFGDILDYTYIQKILRDEKRRHEY